MHYNFKMERIWNVLLSSLLLLPCLKSSIVCVYEVCNGSGAYCCDGYCCYDDDFYNAWWFFVVIIVPIILLAAIIGYCCRRHRRDRMAAMRRSEYPAYGTTVVCAPRGVGSPIGHATMNNNVPSPPSQAPYGYQQPAPQHLHWNLALPSYNESEGYKQHAPPPYTGK